MGAQVHGENESENIYHYAETQPSYDQLETTRSRTIVTINQYRGKNDINYVIVIILSVLKLWVCATYVFIIIFQ